MNETTKKYLKDHAIENIIDDYLECNNLDYEDLDGLLVECEEQTKYIKDNPIEYFKPKLTQEDVDHATKYGYNPTE